MANYARHVSVKKTPQSEEIPGAGQVKNSAGGFVFEVDDWKRLERFLVLGTEGGTFYATEKKLTQENAAVVLRCAKLDGTKTVNKIVEISQAGRAPKNDPAIFALALCAKLGDLDTRRAAFKALPNVCRIGTHLFHFAAAVQELGGWGRATVNGITAWYENKPAASLAYQAMKYQSRDGWSHRDLLRLTHIKSTQEDHKAIYHWMVKGWDSVGETPHPNTKLAPIWAFERAKKLTKDTDVKELVRLVSEYDLPHECIPTEMKRHADVWAALIPNMGITALIRNLGKMTEVGVLSPMSPEAAAVISRLTDVHVLKQGRVHPISLLVALNTYAQGHGMKGKLTWTPVQQIVNALDAAFYLAFKAVEPTNKRTLLALDISGSMDGGEIAGMPGITPRIGSAAMSLVTANVEAQHAFIAFTTQTKQITVSPRQRLDDVVDYMQGLQMGGTDCAQPMIWAKKNKMPVDTFIIYTDNETWAGGIHPTQALRDYRQHTGIPAKLVTVGMTATEFTIADPRDSGQLDVIGFDSATPAVIGDFAR